MTTRLHRSEINAQLGKLRRAHGIKVTARQVATELGYPLAEANMDELRGIIAGLTTAVKASTPGDHTDLLHKTTAALNVALSCAHPGDDASREALAGCLDVLQEAVTALHGPGAQATDHSHLAAARG
jgi:hypothetical protein